MLQIQPTISDGKIIDDKFDAYIPDEKENARKCEIAEMLIIADELRTADYTEFNGNTLLDRASTDLELFNGNTPPGSADPDEDWHANTVNPLTRNRCISIMAHLIQAYLYPTFVAQNEDDEEDKEMSMIMNDSVEFALEQAKYSEKMMNMLYAFVSEPIVLVKVDYCKVYREVKRILDEPYLDEETEKEVNWEFKRELDQELSGYQIDVMPYDEVYFGSIRTPLQRQPFIITQKIITHAEAKMKYGECDKFEYVPEGAVMYYDQTTDSHYQKSTEDVHGNRVRELIIYVKSADLELVDLNGVLIYDDVDRPMQREDKLYPFAETGFEMIHNRFIYYKSLVSKLAATQIDLNDLWNAVKDMARYKATPSTYSWGFEEMDSSTVPPGMNINSPSKEAGIAAINPNSDLNDAMAAIEMLTNAQNENSQDPRSAGVAQGGDKTKYEVERLEANAQTVLGLSGEMLAKLVRQIGELMVGLVIQHMPVSNMMEETSEAGQMKLMSFVIGNRDVDGKKMSRKVEFTYDMPTGETEEELEKNEMQRSIEMLDLESKKQMSLAQVDPDAFMTRKYKSKCEPQFQDRATKMTKRLQLYDRLLANPLANQGAALRNLLLGTYVPGEEDVYMMDENQLIQNEAKKLPSKPTGEKKKVESESPVT